MKGNYENIFERIKQNISSDEDHKKISELFGKPELEYDISDALYGQLEKMDEENREGADFNSMYKRLWVSIKTREKKLKQKRTYVAIMKVASVAAIVAMGIIIGILLPMQVKKTDLGFVSMTAPSGSISKMYLPDSTLIFLNAGSQIKYRLNNSGKEREVFLKGEAWFDVAKNKDQPFIVNTRYYNVRVLGTEFNIKAYEEDNKVITTLEEGSVEIISGDEVVLQQPILIEPGEQLSYSKEDRHINIKEVNSSLYSSWRNNKLIFMNEDFRGLADILERKYGVEIIIRDTSINKFHYDGTIKDESIFEMLDRIQATLPIKYHIEGQQVIIEKK